jgi:recombination protein RecR
MILPEPIQRLIDALSRLPGVGPKTASRLTFHLLRTDGGLAEELSAALAQLRSGTATCGECFNITTAGRELCLVCANAERDRHLICVVEEPLDVLALEGTGGYKGLYHVLGGALSPIEGIGPDDLKIGELVARVKAGGVQEVIVATNPSMEGDATAMYLQQQLAPLGPQLTRLARGLPMGGDLEYADQSTLLRALVGRQTLT